MSSKVGLYRDEKGKAKIILPFAMAKGKESGSSSAKYPDLPPDVCAICWERLEDEAGIRSSGQSMIRSGIPSSDPLDPSASALAPSARTVNQHQQSGPAASSANGLVYADAQVHTPYQAKPCGHRYCYVCIAGKLLSEEAAEDIADSREDEEQINAWTCLRCAKGVASADRDDDDVQLIEEEEIKEKQS
jgi:peroxin-2